MWIFTKYGFFSAVRKLNSRRIVVRARVKSHLERLRERFREELKSSPVILTPVADYPYRIEVSATVWRKCFNVIAAEIDYDNFKDEVSSTSSPDYKDALYAVWATMRRVRE